MIKLESVYASTYAPAFVLIPRELRKLDAVVVVVFGMGGPIIELPLNSPAFNKPDSNMLKLLASSRAAESLWGPDSGFHCFFTSTGSRTLPYLLTH